MPEPQKEILSVRRSVGRSQVGAACPQRHRPPVTVPVAQQVEAVLLKGM